MSDDLPSFPDLAQTNIPWVLAAAMTLWGFTLRLILGRELKAQDKMQSDIASLKDDVSDIRQKLAAITAIMMTRKERENWLDR